MIFCKVKTIHEHQVQYGAPTTEQEARTVPQKRGWGNSNLLFISKNVGIETDITLKQIHMTLKWKRQVKYDVNPAKAHESFVAL